MGIFLRVFLGLGLCSALIACGPAKLGSQVQPASKVKPNVIYILLDDAGINDFGAYGAALIKTPNIDRMAEEGMRFTRHYSGAPVCGPARSVLMTGQHTGHTRRRHNNPRVYLQDEDVTVAEVFKQAGYRTAAIGKWGLGAAGSSGAPTRQGFDQFFGYLQHKHAHYYYPDYLYRDEVKVEYPNNSTERTHYSHDLLTEEALGFIEGASESPFFLYLAYTVPHTELDVPEDSIAPYRGLLEESKPYSKQSFVQKEPRATYAGMMSRLDLDVGKILKQLERQGIDDNTLVLISSDNGSANVRDVSDYFDSNGIYRGYKRDLHEGGIIAPFIARWPGKIAAGSVSDHLSGHQDFWATAADIVDMAPAAQVDGISLLPTLLGQTEQQQRHSHLYWEYNHFHKGAYGHAQAVIQGDWKLLRFQCSRDSSEACYQLYNLAQDPSETTDLANAEHGRVKSMIQLMGQSHQAHPDYPVIFYKDESTESSPSYW